MIPGLILLVGGLLVTALVIWQSRQEDSDQTGMLKISEGLEAWLYGGGGAISAVLGGLVLLDHFS
ncbi:hypothetical protein [Altererythrobacter sp.]|uniref:hypothetical protein n=1 Tax=Altererythrobacter sp. TaxID=1872480 RepID=UPI001B2B3C78|nr:hypothetical protein [Altererythrobacter sp.]MBO6609008.1 hypothetical protein [Altererythrobacter sp.]MBO6642547.1 hypothetical protein [Altererythrobacter sp.]MBO6708945.1 hypothetical protein [Altererythrobacter sp.]